MGRIFATPPSNDEDAFVRSLIEVFTPKAFEAFENGLAWWEFKETVNEILEEKADWRTINLDDRSRKSALRAYRNRIHPRVLDGLQRIYPKAELQ